MAKNLIPNEQEIRAGLIDRLFVEDGNLNVTYGDGRTVNLGSVQGEPGVPGEKPDIAEIVDEVIKVIPIPENGKDGKDGVNGEPGVDGVSPDVDFIIEEVLKKIPVPKDGVDGKDGKDGKDGVNGEPGKDGISPNVDEIADLVRKLIPTPKNGEPGEPGKPGKDAPFSTHMKIIDVATVTNQDQSGKEIFALPVSKFATVTVDLIACGATSFVSGSRCASFTAKDKVGEDQVLRPSKYTNPALGFELVKTASGCAVVIKGSETEEMEWVGTITINEIV